MIAVNRVDLMDLFRLFRINMLYQLTLVAGVTYRVVPSLLRHWSTYS